MFKITEISITNHPVLKTQSIKLIDTNEQNNSNYVSLLIGENGTGKSQILNTAITIINYLRSFNSSKSNPKWREEYTFSVNLFKDGKTITINSDADVNDFENIELFLPKVVLANAYTFNDSFSKSENQYYKYGGLKTTTNNIFIQRPSEDMFNNLCSIILKKGNIKLLNETFKELKLKRTIKVNYRLRRNSSLINDKDLLQLIGDEIGKKNITKKSIEKFKEIIEKYTGINDENRVRRFQDDKISRALNKDNENRLKDLLKYLVDLYNKPIEAGNNLELPLEGLPKNKKLGETLKLEFEYDWTKDENSASNVSFIEHINAYRTLSDIDVLSFTELQLFRSEFFNSGAVSSGEFHLLHLFSFLIANIEENALVLLDEPEISLHANWQYKFFKLINPIIEKSNTSHFIIASHSHFLVSDLKKTNSSIISLIKDDNGIISTKNLEKIDTYGWSVEQILFEVFRIPSDRNYYLSALVEDIVSELSKNQRNNKRLNDKVTELKKYDYSLLNKNDPMKIIIEDILNIWPGEKVAK